MLFIASLAVIAAACDGDEGAAAGKGDVEQAVTIAKAVEANPDDAEAILEKHGMSEADFEALMFEIAESPEKSEEFTAKAGGAR